MAMRIVGGKVTNVKAERTKDGNLNGVEFKINFVDMKRQGGNMTISYTYLADYKDGIGTINVNGEIHMTGTPEEAEVVEITWKKDKKVPEEQMEPLVNAVSRTGGQTATLLAYSVDLVSPLVFQIPQFRVKDTKEKKA